MDITGLIVDKIGLGAGLVFGFLMILWSVLKYTAKRLFDENNGIVTNVANEHIEVMKTIAETQTNQHIDLIQLKHHMDELITLHKDTDSILSNKKLHEAALIACDILEDVGNELSVVDIKDNIRKIRIILGKDG